MRHRFTFDDEKNHSTVKIFLQFTRSTRINQKIIDTNRRFSFSPQREQKKSPNEREYCSMDEHLSIPSTLIHREHQNRKRSMIKTYSFTTDDDDQTNKRKENVDQLQLIQVNSV